MLAILFTRQRVEGDVLSPVGDAEDVVSLVRPRVPAERPDGALEPARPLDTVLLLAQLAPDGDDAVAEAEGQVLPIVGPRAAVYPGGNVGNLLN